MGGFNPPTHLPRKPGKLYMYALDSTRYYVCIYVCMHVFMCVCMYVCYMYVCMHQMCSNFLAGGMIRSWYKALDETAVFGFCCGHEFPGRFINLKHGKWFVNCHEFYCVKCY